MLARMKILSHKNFFISGQRWKWWLQASCSSQTTAGTCTNRVPLTQIHPPIFSDDFSLLLSRHAAPRLHVRSGKLVHVSVLVGGFFQRYSDSRRRIFSKSGKLVERCFRIQIWGGGRELIEKQNLRDLLWRNKWKRRGKWILWENVSGGLSRDELILLRSSF